MRDGHEPVERGKLAYSVCDYVMASYLADWHRQDEDGGSPSAPFIATSAFHGQWQGLLQNGGANVPVQLHIESSEAATLAIGNRAAQAFTEMRMEGDAFTGSSTGEIDSPDAVRTHANTLQIKLLPHNDRLIGRLFAIAGDPNIKNVRLPYVLDLSRN